MPRTTQEILDQADELAARFENHEPNPASSDDADALRELRTAFSNRAEAERALVTAVDGARAAGHSWASIGAMVATSGEAARQRYGRTARRAWTPERSAKRCNSTSASTERRALLEAYATKVCGISDGRLRIADDGYTAAGKTSFGHVTSCSGHLDLGSRGQSCSVPTTR